jgi:phosphoribosylcarboxyaminoimidazole (NCAIR) mutase
VAAFAVGKSGAINAALFAATLLGGKYPEFRAAYEAFRRKQTERGVANQDIKPA